MEVRIAKYEEINTIMDIIHQAQQYIKEQGFNQWQNNYPNAEIIRNDIDHQYGYVLVDDEVVVGTAAISFDGDKNYDYIEGEWLNNGNYAVIHRIAVNAAKKGKGLASKLYQHAINMCLEKNIHSLRVDTHEKNLSMQRSLQKNGFQYCGIIYLEDGNKRMAFEKLIS